MNEVLELLLANLDAAYDRRGWHGTNLRGALRGVNAERALRRPGKGRHNVWELTVHAAYWKYAARTRLLNGKRRSFPMKGSNWFPSPARPDEDAWRALIRLLDQEHRLLREAIASLSDADLRDPKKLRMVYGVAAHDVYHTGQIQVVKRLVGG
ncbi:MAG TPA: DinB family protein [Thermoanaerobaculia bacterium]